MTKQVLWNKFILDRFIELSFLTDEEIEVIKTRAIGWTIPKQAMELGMSESKISKIIYRINMKYDSVQKLDPMLPPRQNRSEIYKTKS